MTSEAFMARKAIESLRAGVPNRAAVAALGTNGVSIVEAFERECGRIAPTSPRSKTCLKRGFFLEGNFGSGKSHALRFLQTIAASKKIAFATVSISKETQLGDMSALYRSAIESIDFGDGNIGGTLAGLFERFEPRGGPFVGLKKAVSEAGPALNPVFLASLRLLERYRAAPEIIEQLCDFWDGGPPQTAVWKRLLRDIDDTATPLRAVRVADLARERFAFAALALVHAGYAGLCIALDEVELIANFGLRARAKGYASLCYLFGNAKPDDVTTHWFSLGAITEDLTSVVVGARKDPTVIEERFRFEPELVANALAGIDILTEKGRTFRLKEPGVPDLERAHKAIKHLYEEAYQTRMSDAFASEGILSLTKSMRSYVREWIAFWDLKMQDPSYTPTIASRQVEYSLDEDGDLETLAS